MNKIILLLGSNMGNSELNIKTALLMIHKNAGKVVSVSSLYKTAPWGFEHENYFLNQVIIINTVKSPDELLKEIIKIEKTLGRTREEHGFKARTIDIDILFYNNLITEDKNLTIPHPHLHKRKFTLIPLAEVAENYIHPVLKKTIKELLFACEDNLEVIFYKKPEINMGIF